MTKNLHMSAPASETPRPQRPRVSRVAFAALVACAGIFGFGKGADTGADLLMLFESKLSDSWQHATVPQLPVSIGRHQ